MCRFHKVGKTCFGTIFLSKQLETPVELAGFYILRQKFRASTGFHNDKVYTFSNCLARELYKKQRDKSPFLETVKPSPILEFINEAKSRHPDHIILIHQLNSFEVFGIDAINLVEHVGLKPIGNTAHVKIPLNEVRKVLDTLLDQGFNVAVYKSVTHSDVVNDTLSMPKIVNSLQLINVMNKEQRTFNIETGDADVLGNINGTVLAVAHDDAFGFSISLINPEMSSVHQYERLSLANALRLMEHMQSRVVLLQDNNENVRKVFNMYSKSVHHQFIKGDYDTETFHRVSIENVARRLGTLENFNIVRSRFYDENTPLMDHVTASNLGLSEDSLFNANYVSDLVTANSHYYMKRYIQHLLVNLPTLEIAKEIRYINQSMSTLSVPIHQVKPVSIYRLSTWLNGGKTCPVLLKSLHENLEAFTFYLDALPRNLVKSVFKIVMHDLNIKMSLISTNKAVQDCLKCMNSFLKFDEGSDNLHTGIVKVDKILNKEVGLELKRSLCIQEIPRGLYHDHLYKNSLDKLDEAAYDLIRLISEHYIGYKCDTGGHNKNIRSYCLGLREHVQQLATLPKVFVNERCIGIKSVNERVYHTNLHTIQVIHDNKQIRCLVCDEVIRSYMNFNNTCELLSHSINKLGNTLVGLLSPHAQVFALVSHFLVVVQTLYSHSSNAVSKGWNQPTIGDTNRILLKGLKPLCMDSDLSLGVDVDLDSFRILTGLPGSGKTVIQKSLLLSCILANIGMYCPCGIGSRVPFFTNYFYYRTPPKTVSDRISSVEYQLKFFEKLIQFSGNKSLVLLDNFCSDLPPKVSNAIIGMLMKTMSDKKCVGFMSTNMQEYFFDCRASVNNGLAIQRSNLGIILYPGVSTMGLKMDWMDSIGIDADLMEKLEKECKVINHSDRHTDKFSYKSKTNKVAILKQYPNLGPLLKTMPSSLYNSAQIALDCLSGIVVGDIAEGDLIHIMPNTLPPPSFDKVPILYFILFPMETPNGPNKVQSDAVQKKTPIYIGETENIVARLSKHRNRSKCTINEYFENVYMQYENEMTRYLTDTNNFSGQCHVRRDILHWNMSHIVLLKQKSRQDARNLERSFIKRMYKHSSDFIVLSQRDGEVRA